MSAPPTMAAGWFASFVPSMNFTAVITLTIASLYLAGVVTSYTKCGNQGACSIMNENYEVVSENLALSWTIICIVVAAFWIISREPRIHASLLEISGKSLANLVAVYLPLLAVSLTLLVTAIIATTRINDDKDIIPETGLSKASGGGGETAVLWLLFGLWTSSMFTQGKVENMLAEFREYQ